jgi:AcrR family transcriptional regulator
VTALPGHRDRTDGAASRPARAAPLSPPERRAAIIAATIPLLREGGVGITTRRIAEAAMVAEGTIFNVFPDKETLIAAAVEAALAPAPTVDHIRAIDPDMPLEARLGHAVAALQLHLSEIWRLLAAVAPGGQPRRLPERNQAFVDFGPALAALLEPMAAQLRTPPVEAARTLLAVTLGCSHPAVVEQPLPHNEIVALFLDGMRRKAP